MKKVRKKIKLATINASYVKFDEDDGSPSEIKLPPISVFGAVDKDKAFKILFEEYGSFPFINIEIKCTVCVYEMPLDKFLELADKIKEEDNDE